MLSVLFCNREMPKTSFEAFLCSVGAFTMAGFAEFCPKYISYVYARCPFLGQAEFLGAHSTVGPFCVYLYLFPK